MRRLVLRLCCLLALVSAARGQATWDFTSGTGAALSLPTNVTGGTVTATNATITFGNTQPSTGYTGASGGNNASVTAASGALNTTSSSFFSFILTAAAGKRLFVSGLSLGSRSTGTGPTILTLYSSADNFTTPLATATASANSNWALIAFPSFSLFGSTGGALTFRIYGSGGSGSGAGNWRIDDLSLSLSSAAPGPAIFTQPSSQTVPPGATVSFTVGAVGTGSVTYQWRKGGVPLSTITYPSATSATLNLGVVSTSDSGSYDVVVNDSIASVTSSAATLNVSITPATVILSGLSATFDGGTHAATVTTTPPGLSFAITYSGQGANPPTNVGTYPVVATITDPAFSGSATGNLVIALAPQTIAFNANPGNSPLVGVPFTVSATASGTNTPSVKFTVSGNATATGTNNATITINDTTPVTITATQAGDANNAVATPATLSVTAINPPAISGTYSQNFDTLATGLPAGWRVFTGASPTSLGTDVSSVSSSLILSLTPGANVAWGSATGNFRNVASALNGGVTPTDVPGTQGGYLNRALGVRQIGSTDPGAAFAFNFATTGVNVASVSFSAQIVSAQPNATTWLLQAGVGANPSSWITLATFNDPGVFGATTVSVTSSTIGTALNNQSRVWLRVAALTATTFGGTLDTFAIDNFSIVTGPVLGISAPPALQTVASGQSANFSVTAAGTGALSYQWRRNGTTIPGANSSTLNLTNLHTIDTGSIDVVVSDSVSSLASTAAALTVNPIATTFVFSNLTATFDGHQHNATATSSPSGATVVLTYSGLNGTPYSASTDAPTNPGTYLVTATATDTEHQGTGSNILVIGAASGATAPAVTTNLVAQSVAVGEVVTFSIEVTGSPAPVLQWRKDGVAITGATNNTYTIFGAALTDAGRYDVVIANSGGTLASPSATLTVGKKDQTISFAAPTTSYPAGAAVKLAATASSGLPVSYTITSGAGSISGSTLTGLGATVVVRASQAGNATAFNAAENVDQTFTFVSGGSAPFLFGSPSDQTVSAGADVTFSAAALGTPTPTWQWQKDGVAISGATTANLTLTGVTIADAARYTVVATNDAGTATASATLTVRAAPVFTVSPLSQNVASGVNVTLTSSITGSPTPALQWRKNGVAIPGAVSNTLTLVNVHTGDAARYDVVATSSLGTATSTAATLAVTTRDFSGMYFGQFASTTPNVANGGIFALYVRPDGTGAFLSYFGNNGTGFASTSLTVDSSGNFSLTFPGTSAVSSNSLSSAEARTAREVPGEAKDAPSDFTTTTSSITFHGSLDEMAGTLTGTAPELAFTLDGTRASLTGPASAQAGFYQGALVGTAAGRGYALVAPDGQVFLYAADGANIAGMKTTLGANGRVLLPEPENTVLTYGFLALDLGFTGSALNGTVHIIRDPVSTLTGASDALAGTERLANISARGGVTPGAPLIAGFVVTGSTPKQVLIRAAGPALAGAPFNVADALDDPALTLYRGSSIIATNDNWSTPAASATAITTAGTSVNAFAFRTGSNDAALLTTLAPGNYTAQVVAGAASRNGSGTALVEIYEILATGEAPGTRRLVNLSARGPVVPGAPLIAGFVINGTAPQRVLLRGIGPTLATFSVPGALANPTLTLFRGSTILKANDDWFRDPDAALIRDAAAKTGAFALGATSLDASLLLYLEPGAYTAQVSASGATNGTGTALVEIYEVP